MSRLLNFRDYLHRLSKTKTNNKKQTYSLEYANHWHADRHVAIDGLAIGTIKSTPGESCARVALETPGYSHLFYFLYSNSYDTLSFFQAQVLCKNLTHYNRKHGSVIAPCTTPSHQHSLARSGCSIYVWGGCYGRGRSISSLIPLPAFAHWGPLQEHLFEVSPKCLSPADDSIVLSQVYFSQSETDVENSVKNPPPLSSVTLLQMPTF